MAREQVRLSYLTFTLALEEMQSGPFTARAISEHTGMTHRNACRLLRTMHEKKVIHVSCWDKDSVGRYGVRVYSLGHGKDAVRRTKGRQEVNRQYKAKAARQVLAGTPFLGLGARI